MPENVAHVIAADLSRTGQYQPLSDENMLSQPCRHDQVYFRDWKLLQQDYLIIGDIAFEQASQKYQITYRLYDVVRETNIYAAQVSGTRDQVRDLAHLISDGVYQKLAGIRGVFSTKIAYVTLNTENAAPNYRIEVSDADGYRPIELYRSPNAIISLAWSADGRKLAFTHFDNDGRTSIKIVDRISKAVESLPSFPGINSAAAFSPDGKNVAAVDFQYVGGGCGMKDVAYFIGSCLTENECERLEAQILDTYFEFLQNALEERNEALEKEWRSLYRVAWADFHRFLKGWSPGHWKLTTYSERVTAEVINNL